MKNEQLELMKVIEFPKNKNVENSKRKNKLQAAIKMLECLTDDGAEFHIILNKEDALKLFDDDENKMTQYLVITSNYEEGKRMKIDNKNCAMYILTGDEFS